MYIHKLDSNNYGVQLALIIIFCISLVCDLAIIHQHRFTNEWWLWVVADVFNIVCYIVLVLKIKRVNAYDISDLEDDEDI